MNTIEEYTFQNYIITMARLVEVERNWVINMQGNAHETASNKRSKISPGMVLAVVQCAIDRFLHSKEFDFQWTLGLVPFTRSSVYMEARRVWPTRPGVRLGHHWQLP